MRGRPLRCPLLVLALFSSLVIAQGAAAQLPTLPNCSVARCVPPSWGTGQIAAGFQDGPFFPGQTFTPKLTGALTFVKLGLWSTSAIQAVVEVRTTANGLPTPTVLAQAPVAGAPYGPGVLHTATFSPANVVLMAGTRYALVLRGNANQVTTIFAVFPACNAATSGTNDYVHTLDGGATWSTLETRDRSIIFEVCLDSATPALTSTWGRVKAIYR